MAGIVQDEGRWPLVVFTYSGEYTEEDVRRHMEKMLVLLRGGRRCGVIFQLTGARVFSAKERSLFAEFINTNAGALARVCVAASLVTTNTLHHRVLTAVTWVARMPCEVKVFAQMASAEQWVAGQLSTEALAVSS